MTVLFPLPLTIICIPLYVIRTHTLCGQRNQHCMVSGSFTPQYEHKMISGRGCIDMWLWFYAEALINITSLLPVLLINNEPYLWQYGLYFYVSTWCSMYWILSAFFIHTNPVTLLLIFQRIVSFFPLLLFNVLFVLFFVFP